MKLWEYLLQADLKHDLADPDHGERWLRDHPQFLKKEAFSKAVPKKQSITGKQDWTNSIQTLRSIVGRLKTTDTYRASETSPQNADRVVARYMRMLQPSLKPDPEGYPDGFPQGTVVRLRLVPAESRRAGMGSATDVDYFFQHVFASLFTEMDSVCSLCGKILPATAKGRLSRRDTCKRCQQAKAWAKKGSKAKQQTWNEQYRRHRSTAAQAKLPNRATERVDQKPKKIELGTKPVRRRTGNQKREGT